MRPPLLTVTLTFEKGDTEIFHNVEDVIVLRYPDPITKAYAIITHSTDYARGHRWTHIFRPVFKADVELDNTAKAQFYQALEIARQSKEMLNEMETYLAGFRANLP